MKIGIITFHWATNFGAVLQAYALQHYLQSLGNDVHIINYKPYKYNFSIRSLLSKAIFNNILLLKKERQIKIFRSRFLNQTNRYYSENELKSNPPQFDIYITGSDQVWNPYFTQFGEGKTTLTYFLSFGNSNVNKYAYAISCGTTEYDETVKKIIKPVINDINKIGVREDSGLNILQSVDYKHKNLVVPDPTLLLDAEDYDKLLNTQYKIKKKYHFIYILRSNSLKKKLFDIDRTLGYNSVISEAWDGDIGKWLYLIKHAEFMMTNSYHGMLFCIQYHIPFVVITEKGRLQGMNDRFNTVLSRLNLQDRILSEVNVNNINSSILNVNLNWKEIDMRLASFKKIGYDFLNEICHK